MISVNDGVCQGFAQCDLNIAQALRNTATVPEQEHEPVHEGRNRGHFAWQRVLQSYVRAPVIMRCPHSKTILAIEIGSYDGGKFETFHPPPVALIKSTFAS